MKSLAPARAFTSRIVVFFPSFLPSFSPSVTHTSPFEPLEPLSRSPIRVCGSERDFVPLGLGGRYPEMYTKSLPSAL